MKIKKEEEEVVKVKDLEKEFELIERAYYSLEYALYLFENKKFEELKEEAEKKEKWKPNVGDTYYYLDVIYNIDKDVWRNTMFDKFRWYQGICFETFVEAEKAFNKFMEEVE